MTTPHDKADAFRALHEGDTFVIPNPWDIGSAKLLEALGFRALATTSSGFAATLGRVDGAVRDDEALAHAAAIAAASEVPVSADLENGYADEPAAIAALVGAAATAGLAGCSIEDYSGNETDRIYDFGLARERIAAAAEAAHSGPVRIVLTARAENWIRGNPDLGDTIRRLQAFEEVGADVVYAPGLVEPDDIRSVVESVGVPVNVLARPGGPSVAELAALGVQRISVGGALSLVAHDALLRASRELLDRGTFEFMRTEATWSDLERAFDQFS